MGISSYYRSRSTSIAKFVLLDTSLTWLRQEVHVKTLRYLTEQPPTQRVACGALLLLLLLTARSTQAQAPSELSVCGTQCYEARSTRMLVVDCGVGDPWSATAVAGRWWWGPLTCVGPIEISIQAPAVGEDPLPLFVEVRTDNLTGPDCISFPGSLIWQTLGVQGGCDPDSVWVTSPVLNLPSHVEIAREYWLQIEGFTSYSNSGMQIRSSPYVRCVRLQAYPQAVAAARWGRVKSLYR